MRVQASFFYAAATVLLGCALTASEAGAQTAQYASKQRAAAAAGYYARSRAMLVEALAEFEQGRKYARPDLVVDAEEWRLTLISLTEELNRLIDPKVRVTRDGVRFAGNPRMVRRERDRLPAVPDGPQDRNTYGEEQRMKEIEKSRRDLYDVPSDEGQGEAKEAEEPVAEEAAQAPDAEAAKTEQKESVEQVIENAVGEAGIPQSQKEALGLDSENPDEKNPANEGTETEQEKLSEGGKDKGEDQQVTSAIEDAIKERLKSLEVGTEQSGTEAANPQGGGEEIEEGAEEGEGEQTTNPGIE